MPIISGTRLGPYEVVAPIGAGGMGEVYRARDTRLERDVAVKVLPSEFTTDAQLRIRFEREAKTISQLNHPHICTLFDVGEGYLVMEMLEGESLADRLAKGPLPTDQVLRIGIEIASALDRAHHQGVIHRDLKPGNIMLTKSGSKLLDFGLAKSAAGGVVPLATAMATEAKPLTQEGTIIGTFQYMAPEQLEGREADARSDIFGLGAVLYEMVTGKRAFEGKTKASLIASILDRDPIPVTTLQPVTPPALEHVISTCLEKDPDARWQTAHDVLLELKWIDRAGSGAGAPAVTARKRRIRERGAWAVAVTALAAAMAVTTWHFAINQPPRVIHASINPPEKAEFVLDGAAGPMALSPDGKRIAFVAATEGKNVLWMRALDTDSAQPLAGTDGAQYPFWSPDSRYLGFFAGGKLKKIEATGGPPQTLCDASPQVRGGTWNPGGVIVFAPGIRDGLSRVSAAGGTPIVITQLDQAAGEFTHRFPQFLPDGHHFLYMVQSFTSALTQHKIYIGSLDGKERKFLLPTNGPARYSPTGHLLFLRERTLMAQRFDASRLQLSGEAQPVAEKVQYFGSAAVSMFSVSANGELAYQNSLSGSISQLAWIDRTGKEIAKVGDPSDIAGPRLSHSGDRIVYSRVDPQSGGADLWLLDLARNVPARFTFEPGDKGPSAWSPDDRRIAYSALAQNYRDIEVKSSDGVAPPETIFRSPAVKFMNDWSRDGRFILFQAIDPKTRSSWDLWLLDVAKRTAVPYLQTPFAETNGAFSPDGKWIAYVSDESGLSQVYVQPLPAGGGKWQISTGGGNVPQWSDDGKQLFFRGTDGKAYVVSVETTPSFRVSAPAALFPIRIRAGGGLGRQWQVTGDGQRFLVNEPVRDEAPAPITIVTNWAEQLKK